MSNVPPSTRRPASERIHPPTPTKNLSAHVNDALEHLVNAERSYDRVIAYAQIKDIGKLRTRRRAVHRERERLLQFALDRDVPLRTLKRHG